MKIKRSKVSKSYFFSLSLIVISKLYVLAISIISLKKYLLLPASLLLILLANSF